MLAASFEGLPNLEYLYLDLRYIALILLYKYNY